VGKASGGSHLREKSSGSGGRTALLSLRGCAAHKKGSAKLSVSEREDSDRYGPRVCITLLSCIAEGTPLRNTLDKCLVGYLNVKSLRGSNCLVKRGIRQDIFGGKKERSKSRLGRFRGKSRKLDVLLTMGTIDSEKEGKTGFQKNPLREPSKKRTSSGDSVGRSGGLRRFDREKKGCKESARPGRDRRRQPKTRGRPGLGFKCRAVGLLRPCNRRTEETDPRRGKKQELVRKAGLRQDCACKEKENCRRRKTAARGKEGKSIGVPKSRSRTTGAFVCKGVRSPVQGQREEEKNRVRRVGKACCHEKIARGKGSRNEGGGFQSRLTFGDATRLSSPSIFRSRGRRGLNESSSGGHLSKKRIVWPWGGIGGRGNWTTRRDPEEKTAVVMHRGDGIRRGNCALGKRRCCGSKNSREDSGKECDLGGVKTVAGSSRGGERANAAKGSEGKKDSVIREYMQVHLKQPQEKI